MNAKITNAIIQSVNTIVEQKLAKAKFNITVFATVMARGDNELEYKLNYQGNTITAYALEGAGVYDKGTVVCVLIPNGDFTSRNKFILGKSH